MREVDTTVIGKCAAENGEVVDAVLGITFDVYTRLVTDIQGVGIPDGLDENE